MEPLGCHYCGNDFQLNLSPALTCNFSWQELKPLALSDTEEHAKKRGEISAPNKWKSWQSLWGKSCGRIAPGWVQMCKKMKTQMINGYKCLRREQTQTLRIKRDKQIRNLSWRGHTTHFGNHGEISKNATTTCHGQNGPPKWSPALASGKV